MAVALQDGVDLIPDLVGDDGLVLARIGLPDRSFRRLRHRLAARRNPHLCRERAELLAKGTGRRRREKLKDALIGVLRDRHDPETWDDILAEAQARSEREGL